MKLTEAKTLNMTEGRIGRLLVTFAIPLLVGYLFQQLYNLVDSLIIGNYEGSDALAAVGIGHYPLNICVNFFLGLSGGVTVLVSRHFGSGDREALRQNVENASSLVIAASLPVMVLGYVLANPILRAVNTPDSAYALTYAYMVPLFLGIAGTLGYNMNAGILRGMGDSVSPLVFLIIATVVNIAFDFLFIGAFRWSAFGAALATVIAQWTSWIYSIIHINRRYPEYRIRPLRIRFHAFELRRLIRVGLPMALSSGLFALGHTILSGIVNSNGTAFSAGYNVAMKLDALDFYTLASFAAAVTTFAGQNVGAGRFDRLRSGLLTGLAIALSATVVTSLLVALPSGWLVSLFDRSPDVVAVGRGAVIRFVPYYVIYTAFYMICAFLNGIGDTKISLAGNMFLFWAVRLPAAFLLNRSADPINVFYCYPISWIGGLLIVLPYFLSGRWKKKLEREHH